MLSEEVALYSQLTGRNGLNVPIGIIGAYLDGYERGKASAQPKTGKWIHISEEMWKCDQCGEISCCSPNFCPDCGSDMRQREEQNG